MMRTKLFSALLIVGAATASQVAFAVDGTITFKGAVIGQTCKIDGAGSGSANFTVTLPDVEASKLSSAGAFSPMTQFNIVLTGCPSETKMMATFFEPGPNIDLTTNNLKPDEGPGQATNVQIQLASGGQLVLLGKADYEQQQSQDYQVRDGKVTLPYGVRYYATGAATAGGVNAQLQYTLVYL